jgi:hypothetical protein
MNIEKGGVQEGGLIYAIKNVEGVGYRGQWRDGKRHGMGVQTWSDGSGY